MILSGSRGAGRATANSDYDVQVIVEDSALPKFRLLLARRALRLDLWVRGLSSFDSDADAKPQTEGYGPMYAHIKVPIDKTGRIAAVARRKGRIPNSQVKAYTSAQLDAYLNELLRSLKCFRDGLPFAGHLEATRSIPYLLEALFGSEGRWAPYAKYLEWELQEFPLRQLPISRGRLRALINRILRDGDASSQRTLYRAMERSFRRRGYGKVIDGWEPAQLVLLRSAPRR